MILNTKQHEVADTIVAHLGAYGQSILKAGLQTKADNIIAQVINQTDFKEVCLFGRDYKHVMHVGNTWDRRTSVQYQKWPELSPSHNVLIVIPDAFNVPHSYGIWLLAVARGYHVIAYGSWGPEYDRVRDWPLAVSTNPEIVQAFNSWDLNPDFDIVRMRDNFPNSFDIAFGTF